MEVIFEAVATMLLFVCSMAGFLIVCIVGFFFSALILFSSGSFGYGFGALAGCAICVLIFSKMSDADNAK